MLGPLIVDLFGSELSQEEEDLLRHPLIGGVILFARNCEDAEQVHELAAAIHRVRSPPLLVTIDQEGGRVQRLKHGVSRLPPAAVYGEYYDRYPKEGVRLAHEAGWLMSAELRALEIDASYAPVLDLQDQRSQVIGDRAFHKDPEVVSRLAIAFAHGMHEGGLAAVGKHFPGHGGVIGDTHFESVMDSRPFVDLMWRDIVPFRRLIAAGLPAVMMAHVVYPAVSREPASYCKKWIKDILRKQLGFQGAVISDDLSMAAAFEAGDSVHCFSAAIDAGCDLVLVCNDRKAVHKILDGDNDGALDPAGAMRRARLHGSTRSPCDMKTLHDSPRYRAIVTRLEGIEAGRSFDLDWES